MSTKKKAIWLINDLLLLSKGPDFELDIPQGIDILTYKKLSAKLDRTPAEEEEFLKLLTIMENGASLLKKKQPLSEDKFPKLLYPMCGLQKKRLSPIFSVRNGFIIATESFANLLLRFNLGSTQIREVRISGIKSNDEAAKAPYFYINICEHKEFFLPEYSDSSIFHLNISGKKIYSSPSDKIELQKFYYFSSESLKSSVDLWHDPQISDSIFMSENLQQAICEAGIRRKIPLMPCYNFIY